MNVRTFNSGTSSRYTGTETGELVHNFFSNKSITLQKSLINLFHFLKSGLSNSRMVCRSRRALICMILMELSIYIFVSHRIPLTNNSLAIFWLNHLPRSPHGLTTFDVRCGSICGAETNGVLKSPVYADFLINVRGDILRVHLGVKSSLQLTQYPE